MKKMKRFLSLLLAVIMVLTSADFSALAAENSANPSSKPANGTTVSQPYKPGETAESEKFRIPAMVTLDSGRIVTAADARYNTHMDGGGLDTIVSWSDDNGANWEYTVANYLGDNGNTHNYASTAFIDPILTTDGTNVYMMVDLWPAGYALNGANEKPPVDAENGFDDNNGNLRLSGDDRASYGYYLKKNEDASPDSYYVIMQTGADGAEDTVVEGCTVDEYFNIQGYVEETGEAVSEARDTAYSADDRFQFPAPGQTETLEAEYMVLQNSGENEDWPLEIVENSDWAGNGKFVNSLNSGDTATLYYNAPRAGTYTATVTYRSGSSANGFSLTETSGKITENENVTMGNDDSGVTCTGTFNLEVTTAGEGTLVITGGASGGPQIDKIDIKAAFETFQYTEGDRFQFPDSGETKLLEAEYMELHNDTTGDGEWPLQIGDAEEWASNGKIVDAMKSGDYIDLYYNAPKAGRYTATFTYRSGSASNGFSWEEVSGDVAKISSGEVTMGADDNATANHEADVTFEVLEAGEGILRITSGSAGGPQLDKIEFSLTSVPVDTNLFCADSPFEVYPTDYLYLTKSTDGGETWGAPTLVNAKKAGEQSYLVGPGRGLVTSDGTIIIPCYVHDNGTGSERTSFIYSRDNGVTWTRTEDATSIRSSEAQVVELSDGTLRFFFRNDESQVCYVDATSNAADGYSWGQVVYTGVYSCSNTQMSAIKYSKRIDGKEAIIISYPASRSATGDSSWDRYNGRISIGLVQADGSMDWKYTYAVNDGGAYFWYSCLTELNDQGIALLYENGASGAAITYETYTIEELAPEAGISDIWVADADGKVAEDVTVAVGESVTLTVKDIPENDTVTVTAADGTVLEAAVTNDTLTLAGLSTGDAAYTNTTVTVSTVSGGEVTFDVTVTDQAAEKYEFVTLKLDDSMGAAGAVQDTPVYDGDVISIQTSSYDSPIAADIENLAVGQSTTMLLVMNDASAGTKYAMSSASNDSGSTKCLDLDTITADSDLSGYYWKVTRVAEGYTIQTLSDPAQYIMASGENVQLGSAPTIFSFNYVEENDAYSVSYVTGGNTKYFNKFGGGFNRIGGYSSHDGALFNFWQAETVITGENVGTTAVKVGDTLYYITVEANEQDVLMYVGDELTYTGALEGDNDSAAVNIETNASYPYSNATDIVDGGSYLITSQDESAIVKNEFSSSGVSGWWSSASGFLMGTASFADTDYSDHLWTFTAVNGGTDGKYYVQNKAGAYLKIASDSVTVVTNEQPVIVVTGNATDGYTLSNADSTYKLNNFGDENMFASGYSTASTWYLYAGTNPITAVTAVQIGTADVQIGNVIYHITVKEAAATYVNTVYLTVGETEERTNQGQYDASITVDESYDEAVVTAALTDSGTSHSVTFTGVAEGRTVVDVGPTRYYVYVTKAATDSVVSEEDIVVYVGQTKNLISTENGVSPYEWAEGYDTYLENCSVYGVNQDLLAVRGNNNNTIEYGGISKYYVGDMVDLSDCLYTFTVTDDGKYYVTGVTSDGTTVYLNHHDAGVGKANTTVDGSIYVTDAGDNLVYLNDINGTTNRYLYFHKDGTNRLNLNTGEAAECKFALYRPATADELTAGADTVLPGYVQATQVTSGQQYLIVTSYAVDGVTYYYALYPSTGTGAHDQTVQIIADQVTGNKYSSVTFTGKAPGETTLTVDTKKYNITVLEKPDELNADSTPFVSGQGGESNGRVVTKLVMSADRTFDLNIGNGYSDEGVTWKIIDADEDWNITLDADGNEVTATWAEIDENGVITATTTDEHSLTYRGYAVATIGGVDYKIPIQISPSPSATDKRSHDIYFKTLSNVDTYYGWIYGVTTGTDDDGNPTYTYYPTTLVKAIEGQVLYVSTGKDVFSAIDFFAAPKDGYALTRMSASGSLGHYKRLEGEPAQVEFITAAENTAGKQQYAVAPDSIVDLITQAKVYECDGAQGFTRPVSHGNLSTTLEFYAEKLPTVEKKVRGVLGASQQEETYRAYTEGMAVTEGEYIYFDVIVTTYDTETRITYEDVVLTDTLVGATFNEKDGTTNPTNQDGLSYKDITAEINADGLVGAVHEYYAVYEVTKTDIEDSVNGTKDSITNHVDLEFKYSTTYSNGDYEADAAAEAEILLADDKLDDIVVDFGLAVQQIHYTAGTDSYYMPTGDTPLETMYGEVTITNEAVTDTDGNVTGYNNIITYTPTKVIEGMDTVTMVDAQGVVWVFYVYPGTSVYYEEGFADYTGDWGTDISKGTGYQTLREIDTETTTNSELKDPYGYDAKYAVEAAGPSNESEAVSSTAGNRAEFTFTGGGVDIYANGQGDTNPTGTLSVLVRNADTGTMEKLLIVSTKVAGTDGDVTEGQNSLTSAYNLPVASVRSLSQGTHQVTIGHSRTQEEANNNTTYPVRLDGFRVYLTMKDQSIYLQHEEANPVFLEMRNAVLGAIDLSEVLKTTDAANASIYAEDIAAGLTQVYNSSEAANPAYTSAKAYVVKSDADVYTASAKDLLDNGPKNELFLYPGESLIFGLVGGLSNVQIGMKAVNGAVDVMSVTKQINTTAADGTTTTTAPEDMGIASLATSTDMFYRIGGTDASTDTETKTATITITNNSTNGSVLSITDLKYFNATMSTVEPLTDLSANDFMPMVLALGYTENPDANEPTEAKVTDVFSDVVEGAWYVDAVQYVYDANIMTGSGNLFTPENDMTRAQVVTTLYRLAGSPEVTDYSACEIFTDVEEGVWYADAVCWAYNTKVTTGNSAATFGVDDPVTREQLSTFLYRYANNEGLDTTASGDLTAMENADQVNDYAADAVKWAVGTGLISGAQYVDANGNTIYDLAPQATATRAQMAAILMRFCEAYNL